MTVRKTAFRARARHGRFAAWRHAKIEDVAFADGRVALARGPVARRDDRRSRCVTRHRHDRGRSSTPSRTRSRLSATRCTCAFRGLRRSARRRRLRHRARDARRQRGRGRSHPQPEDRAQPDPGRRGVGHRHGAARGDVHRPQPRPLHESQLRRVSRPGERRRAGHRRDLRRRARRHRSIRSA